MQVRRSVRAVAAGAAALLLLALAPMTAAQAATAPTISITSPTGADVFVNGASATVTATATTDAPTENPTVVELFVDSADPSTDASPIDTYDCLLTSPCGASLTWPLVGVTAGAHTIAVRVTTDNATTAVDTLTVTVGTPPTAAVTSPADGTTVRGTVDIGVSGVTDADIVSDYPSQFRLVVDGAATAVTTGACDLNAPSCATTLAWNTSSLTPGTSYDVAVKVTTHDGHVVTSPTRSLRVASDPTLTFDSPAAGTSHQGVVSILVTGTTDGQLAGDYPQAFGLYVDGSLTAADTAGPCAGTTNPCQVTLQWDTTGLSAGDHALVVKMTSHLGDAATPVSRTLKVGTAPTVVFVSPAAGGVRQGSIDVSVTGSTDSSLVGERPSGFALSVGGSTVATATGCAVGVTTCTKTLTWNSTGAAPGATVVTVSMTTVGGKSGTATRSITIANDPTVAITSPATGSTQAGIIDVTARGVTDSRLAPGEYPKTFQLFLDAVVTAVDSAGVCPSNATTCDQTMQWNSAGAAQGPHDLLVRMTTNAGRTVEDTIVVVIGTDPTVSITSPDAGSAQHGVADIGVVGTTNPDVAGDYPTKLELFVDGSLTPSDTDLTCTAGVKTCEKNLQWDTTGLAAGDYSLVVRMTTKSGLVVTDTRTLKVAGDPGVVITSPATGTQQWGRTTITATGSTDAAGAEVPTKLTAYADGTQVAAADCPVGAHVCTLSLVWEANAVADGAHSVYVRMTTSDARTPQSDTISVTLLKPPPVIRLTAPLNKSVVSGTVGVATIAAVSDRLDEHIATFDLIVDGVVKATKVCPPNVFACSTTLAWNTSTYVGPHKVNTRVTTSRGRVASSAVATYYALSASFIRFSAPATVSYGGIATVTGRVIASNTGLGVAGIVVTLVRDPAIGLTTAVKVTTGTGGVFSYRYRAYSNTVVRATSTRISWLGSSTRTVGQLVRAPMRCSATSTLAVGSLGSGSCFVSGLPIGTSLALRYISGGRTFTLATGRSKSTTIRLSFRFPSRGLYYLRVDLSSNAVYTATRSALLPVTVR